MYQNISFLHTKFLKIHIMTQPQHKGKVKKKYDQLVCIHFTSENKSRDHTLKS